MSSSIASIANRVLPLLIAETEDSTFAANPIFQAIARNPAAVKVMKGGGESIYQPVNLGRHSVATQVTDAASAYAQFDPTVNLIEKKATADWCTIYQPVRISEDELRAMSSENAVDFLRDRVTNVLEDMGDRIAYSLLQGVDAPTDRLFSTLQSFNGVSSTTGWFDNAAPTAQANTVLGLSETTYRDYGWFTQYQTAGGTLTEAFINAVLNGARAQCGTSPDIAIVSETFLGKLQALVDSKIQYLSPDKLGFGMAQQDIPVYRGVAMFVDARMGFTASGSGTPVVDAYFLNSKYLRLNIATLQESSVTKARKLMGINKGPAMLSVSEFIPDPNAPVWTARVGCTLQLTASRLNGHGMLVNA